MNFFLRQSARAAISSILIALFAMPQDLVAQAHLVSSAEIQKQVLEASQARQRNLETVRSLFASPAGEKALQSARIDPARVNRAVGTLSDAELAQMAVRARKAQADFAAGNLSDRDLIIIILAVVALVLIIVAVR
jgi:hypothetical protein